MKRQLERKNRWKNNWRVKMENEGYTQKGHKNGWNDAHFRYNTRGKCAEFIGKFWNVLLICSYLTFSFFIFLLPFMGVPVWIQYRCIKNFFPPYPAESSLKILIWFFYILNHFPSFLWKFEFKQNLISNYFWLS